MRRLVTLGVLLSVLVLSVLALPGTAFGKSTKYTFNDVTYPDETTGEIEATVKDTDKNDLTTCSYFSDDYQESLGYYSDEVVFTDPAAVLEFCLDSFDERHQ